MTVGDDSFQMQASPNEAQSFEWDVLGNDSSSAGGLTITSVQSGAAGSAEIVWANPNDPLSHASVSFELNPEFVGQDSLTYTVSDADGDHGTGTIWLTVTAGDSGDGGPLTLAQQMQQLTDQAAKAQADLAAGQAKFGGAISAAQAKLKQQQAADEKKHADALAAAQKKLDEKVNAGHDKAVDAIKAADTAYQQALTERLDAAATAIASGQETLVSAAGAADQLYQAQHQAAVDAATSALDSAAATLVAAHDAAQAAAAGQMAATEAGWNTAVTGASTAFETTYQQTEAALTAAADQAVTLFGTATDGVASSFSTALTTAVSQRDALLTGLSGTAYVTTFTDPAFTAALALADTALNDAITAARANLQGQSTTAMNGYNTATQTAANDLTTGDENATTHLGTDLHNADVAEQTAIHNAQADYDTTAALAQTAYDHSIHGAHDDLVAAVTEDEGALETSVNLAESKFETAAKEALAKYTKWVAEAFGAPVGSTTTTGTTTTGTTTGNTTTTGGAMPGAMPGSSMSGSTGGSMTGSSTGSAAVTLGTFQLAVKADAQTAYDALQLAANVERDACVAADTAYITAITADQTAYLAVYNGLQQALQTAVNTANNQVNSARDAALATYHQHQQQIASTYNSSTTSPMTMEEYMAQSAARQAAEAGAKREFLATVAGAELTAAQTVGQQYVSAVASERGARATLLVALRHDENVWSETKAAAETTLKDQTDIALARFMDDVTTLEGSYDTAAEQKFTTFESKVALAEQTAIVADQSAEAAFENALVADEELEVHADAAAEAAFEHALADDAQSAEKAIALADQSWFDAEGDAEALWLHAETDVSAAYVAALDAAAQGLDTELSADETAQVVAINAALTAWQTGVDNAWSAAFLDANGSSADSTAAADVFLGFGDSVTSSVAGVMTGFNAAYHALTSALVADVAAADQTEAAAARSQTTTIANATKHALHQIGQSLKDEETAEADAEHAATTTVSDAIQGFITGETDAADAQTHSMINAVTGYTKGLVTTAFGALIGDWSDQATRFGAVTGASVGFATSTIDASGTYETATHDADLAALIATHRREERQLKSILNSATSLATAGAAARVAEILTIMRDDLQRLLALDDNQMGQFNLDQMTAVLAARMMIPTDFTGTTAAENITSPNDATPDQLTATETARTIINNAANTAQSLRQSGVQTGALVMMLGNASGYLDSAWQMIDGEGLLLTDAANSQFALMAVKDEAAAVAPAVNPVAPAPAANSPAAAPAQSTQAYPSASGAVTTPDGNFVGGFNVNTGWVTRTVPVGEGPPEVVVVSIRDVRDAQSKADGPKTKTDWDDWFFLNGRHPGNVSAIAPGYQPPGAPVVNGATTTSGSGDSAPHWNNDHWTDWINPVSQTWLPLYWCVEVTALPIQLQTFQSDTRITREIIERNARVQADNGHSDEVYRLAHAQAQRPLQATTVNGITTVQMATAGMYGSRPGGVTASGVGSIRSATAARQVVDAAKDAGAAGTKAIRETAEQVAQSFDVTWCFAPDTLVSTEHGMIPIAHVEPGEQVYSYDFDRGEWILADVLQRHDNRFSGVWVTICVNGHNTEVTANHPFWVVDGVDLSERTVPGHLDVRSDEGKSLKGRWVNSQDLCPGDTVVAKEGALFTVDSVTLTHAEDVPVCNLIFRDHHTFLVGADQILAHNDSWCQELLNSPFAAQWLGKKDVLLKKLDEINVNLIAKGEKPLPASTIHGHHIVMKNSPLAEPARKILEKFEIPVLLTKDQIRNAKSLDDLSNISMAINANGLTGIHLEKYAKAVNEGLEAIVQSGTSDGLPDAVIKANIIKQLAEWRKVLEKGGQFW